MPASDVVVMLLFMLLLLVLWIALMSPSSRKGNTGEVGDDNDIVERLTPGKVA